MYRLSSSPDAGTTSASKTRIVATTVPCGKQWVLVRAGERDPSETLQAETSGGHVPHKWTKSVQSEQALGTA